MTEEFCNELSELIDRYGLNKTEKESYEKLVKQDGDAIKSMMYKANLKMFEGNSYKVSYVVQNRSSFDEAKVLDVIHSFNIPDSLGIIKTKEYIDEDALESAIYRGDLPKDVLDKIGECMINKEVVTLRTSVRKE